MITPAQIAAAEAVQHAAAHDPSHHVRLIAGPGTGKSSAIEARVRWLLTQNIPANAICAVSFTRASATDLRLRIHQYATQPGFSTIAQVPVSTLHSLALRVLRSAGQLVAYPVDPLVLDNWELENIFDEEFGYVHGTGKKRRRQIRLEHEAFWSTGAWAPANYLPPDPPITPAERTSFDGFHRPRTQTYACVLPGEIIRLCVERMRAGALDAVGLLGLQHLIVDEFQDLNPLDLEFVDRLVQQGAKVFVAGDDDQSVYSFRFASPSGIQNFHVTYPAAAQYQLNACFRCTPSLLAASAALIASHPGQNRIPKTHTSLYTASAPPVQGTVCRWRFTTAANEAKAIAASCKALIDAQMNPRDILILLSNQKDLSEPLMTELQAVSVAAEHPREDRLIDTETGRLVLATLRIVCNRNDYISHRAILYLRRGVAVTRCVSVFDAVLASNSNFHDVFYNPLPGGAFTGQALNTINLARATCAIVSAWTPADTIAQRSGDMDQLIQTHYDDVQAADWQALIATLPPDMTLEELRDYIWADTDDQQNVVLEAARVRLGLGTAEAPAIAPRVRIMTMHGAKGLSARVVFVPGLEEQIFPGPWRQPYPGLIMEAARLLYVSITRARAACVLSYATRRTVNGSSNSHNASRFILHLAGAFTAGQAGLSAAEIAQIMTDCSNL